jgi:hypothetical protein
MSYMPHGGESVNDSPPDHLRTSVLDLDTLAHLARDKIPADVPCPLCGPAKRERHKQQKAVLRIWHTGVDFASYWCARCGAKGYALANKSGRRIDRAELAKRMHQAALHQAAADASRRNKARWLWAQSQPAMGTIVETYLRSRGITVLPPTLRFLPARGEHAPCMLAAFGVVTESEPVRYEVVEVHAVHLTRLQSDGNGKAPDAEGRTKIMVGVTDNWPIALVPPNDLGGLAVAEGIEDALSLHEATGLGAWAAGAAARLPKLAPLISSLPYIEFVHVAVDDDPDGRRYSAALAAELRQRRRGSLEVATIESGEVADAAA